MSSFLDYLEEDKPLSPVEASDTPVNDKQKSTALHCARTVQYQKRMQEKVLDLIVSTVDLPSRPEADPGRPIASDATLFKQALSLFQPTDFQDVILERNIYEKCAYPLCAKPNLEQYTVLRDKIYRSTKRRQDFRLNSKEELGKWCSMECAERAMFVCLQLGTAPAWLRPNPVDDIKFLDESRGGAAEDSMTSDMRGLGLKQSSPVELAGHLHQLALDQSKKGTIEARMHALSLERGNNHRSSADLGTDMRVQEREVLLTPTAPQGSADKHDVVEGYKQANLDNSHQISSQ